jgi:3-isopropylmalate/(R)-2-methylmalate dehydratase small subunit
MTPFTRLKAIAAAVPIANIDTDMLVPAAFLKTISRKGLGKALLHAARFDANGVERPEFILNRDPWRTTGILVTQENFGCGSSREHAPWALLDFGIRCIIAPSFADIFYGNCFKNGLLPITLDRPSIDLLMEDASHAATAILDVDLEQQTITRSEGPIIQFNVDAARRERLLIGLDDIAYSLKFESVIKHHEATSRQERPWVYSIPRGFD